MSLSACPGLQSCLEPRLTPPCIWRLNAPPKLSLSQSFGTAKWPCVSNSDTKEPQDKPHNEQNTTTPTTTTKNNNNNDDSIDDYDNKSNNKCGDCGGWSFLEALANTSPTSKEQDEGDKVYVHPLVKRSSSMLSEKSLEMCTESLGSETGSDISDDLPSLSLENGKFSTADQSKFRDNWAEKRMRPSKSFPPPLTSISGKECVRVRPQREGGRLVIKAVTVSSCSNNFHAERGDGRLRLFLLKDNSTNFGEEVSEERGENSEENDGVVQDFEADNEAAEEENEEDDVDAETEDSVYWGEEMDGNCECVGGEIGIEKLPRPNSRCKDGGHGNKGMWNLEAYLVATS